VIDGGRPKPRRFKTGFSEPTDADGRTIFGADAPRPENQRLVDPAEVIGDYQLEAGAGIALETDHSTKITLRHPNKSASCLSLLQGDRRSALFLTSSFSPAAAAATFLSAAALVVYRRPRSARCFFSTDTALLLGGLISHEFTGNQQFEAGRESNPRWPGGVIVAGVFFCDHRVTQQTSISSHIALPTPVAAAIPEKSVTVLPFEFARAA